MDATSPLSVASPNSVMTATIEPVLKASFFLIQFVFLLSTKGLTFDRLEHDIRQESFVSSRGKWENVGMLSVYSSEGGANHVPRIGSRNSRWCGPRTISRMRFAVIWESISVIS